MQTSFFSRARNLTIQGGSFNSVNGDQINNITHHQVVYTKEKRERTEYDEFYQVKRGAIYRIRDVSHRVYPRRWDNGWRFSAEEGLHRADTVICTAEINRERGRIFTVVSYEGPEAYEAFEKDFKRYSRAVHSNIFQLYGLNRSTIPSLIFYGEYIPATVLQGRVGFWEQYYIKSLANQLDWWVNELWMDPSTGRLCRGPEGPESDLNISHHPFEICSISSDLDISKKDIFLHFLATLHEQGQRVVLEILRGVSWTFHSKPHIRDVVQPTIISMSTGMTISVGILGWRSQNPLLGMGKVLANGTTRFTLLQDDGPLLRLGLDWQQEMTVWLSQASGVFNRCGIPLEGDLTDYRLIIPTLTLEGRLEPCANRLRRPIHVFIPPLSSTLSGSYETIDSHFWSHDALGETILSTNECTSLSLPQTLLLMVSRSSVYSWDLATYQAMVDLQIAKGFDPDTTDFAEYIEYPLYGVVTPYSGRFEEVEDTGQTNGQASEGVVAGSPREVPVDTTSSGVWSFLSSGWSWNTSEGSDIPVAVV